MYCFQQMPGISHFLSFCHYNRDNNYYEVVNVKNTLKVTNVLSDPTRFNIYQHIIQQLNPVTVLNIAAEFDIHPNVARLHLSKLEEIKLIISHFRKTGKGGRPSRLYELSENVVELNFPHRDYKLLSSIAIESFVELGVHGRQALYSTGRKYGIEVVKQHQLSLNAKDITIEQKIHILEDAGTMLGMYPEFEYIPDENSINFRVSNCPFKEVVEQNQPMVCNLHHAFLKGMFEALFTEIELVEMENMFKGCKNCRYVAKLSVV